MDDPLVTVVIPTYKRQEFIHKAIQSVKDQDYSPIEIIVVNDSPENNLRDLEKQYDITLINHEINQGGSAARNTGIKKARGKYIAFLDDDDLFHSEKIRYQVEFLEKHPDYGAVYTGLNHVDGNGTLIEVRKPKLQGEIFEDLLSWNWVGTTSTVIARKEVFDVIGCFSVDLPAAQDWDMWIKISEKYKIGLISDPLVEFLTHNKMRISSNKEDRIKGYQRVSDKYRDKREKISAKRKSDHFFHMALIYARSRKIRKSQTLFLKSILYDLGKIFDVSTFYLSYLFRKIGLYSKG